MSPLTAAQERQLEIELHKIEELLADISAMLRLICRARGINPEAIEEAIAEGRRG